LGVYYIRIQKKKRFKSGAAEEVQIICFLSFELGSRMDAPAT